MDPRPQQYNKVMKQLTMPQNKSSIQTQKNENTFILLHQKPI